MLGLAELSSSRDLLEVHLICFGSVPLPPIAYHDFVTS